MVRFNSFHYGSLFGYGRSGLGSSLYSSISQLAGVRSGAYRKALQSYYSKDTTTQKSSAKNALTSKTSAKNVLQMDSLSAVKTEASGLSSSAGKLTDTGKGNLFQSKDTYDADAAYKAVSEFVNNYNDTVAALAKTDNIAVKSSGNSMIRMTNIMQNSLSRVGVSVGTDGKLSVDEEAFRSADMNTVKSLFGGSSSYAKIVGSSAERIQAAVSNQQRLGTGSVYGRTGSYLSSSYSGYGFNGYV